MNKQPPQLDLFGHAAGMPTAEPYAIRDEIGGAIAPFIRFCKEMLSATEGDASLALIIEEAWKKGRSHPYLKAFDAHQACAT